MKVRLRCNKRNIIGLHCGARKTADFIPQHKEVPCIRAGCVGFMVPDKHRNKVGTANDGHEICHCDGVHHPISEAIGRMAAKGSPHAQGCKGCVHEKLPF